MPELPEVETLANDLRKTVLGRTVARAWVARDAERLVQGMPVRAFTDGLRGRRIENVGRRGKFLLIGLDRDLWWLVHRRMSGNVIRRPANEPDEPYLRARFSLDDGTELRFVDLRKFGAMWLTDEPQAVLAGLGPEPLDATFTDEVLAGILRKRSAPVKAVLMDQGAIAGIGNLYADEALFHAGVHPQRPAKSVSKAQVTLLREGIELALREGLAHAGSSVGAAEGEEVSLRDHVNLDGQPGSNQHHLLAYGREGEPCARCGTAIERVKLGNRSAHYCPRCQPKSGRRRGVKVAPKRKR